MDRTDRNTRRARLGDRQRNVRRRGLIAVAATAVVALGAGGAYAVWDQRSGSPGDRVTQSRSSTTTNTGTFSPNSIPRNVIEEIVRRHPPRRLSHKDPLRVWVGGDSLAGELGPSLGDALASTGIVQVTVDFKVGSGLHDNGRRNWPREIPAQMAAHSPDVAIFMIGANDASIVTARGEAWAPRYRATVANLLDGLKGKSDRTVYWVGPPTMKANNLNRGTKALSSLMASEARLHENVVFIDAFAMFGDDAGNYTNRIDMPSLNRTNVLVRIGDGVHFTNGGADWIAYNVARALDTQWQITEQSGGTPIRVSVIGGGGSVPGYKPRRNRTSTTTSTSRGAATTTTVDHGSTSTATLTATTVNSSTTTTGLPSTTTPTTTPTT